METYFFSQDQDCHWYMIPLSLEEKWLEMIVNDTEDQVNIDKFENIFSEYRTGGDISNIYFIPINK